MEPLTTLRNARSVRRYSVVLLTTIQVKTPLSARAPPRFAKNWRNITWKPATSRERASNCPSDPMSLNFSSTLKSALTAPVAPPPLRDARHRRLFAATICTAVAGSLIVATVWTRWDRSGIILDDLWGSVLKSPSTVLVCVGLQAAYNLRSALAQDTVQGVIGSVPAVINQPIRDADLILLRDRYVALDDALCLVRITSLLERHRKPYRIRVERSTSFSDLRDTPAVLIGAFDNPWTLRTGGQLRFTFSKDSQRDIGMVHDSEHPEKSDWALTNYWPNWDVPIDYAMLPGWSTQPPTVRSLSLRVSLNTAQLAPASSSPIPSIFLRQPAAYPPIGKIGTCKSFCVFPW
jgi:hypothetical protein